MTIENKFYEEIEIEEIIGGVEYEQLANLSDDELDNKHEDCAFHVSPDLFDREDITGEIEDN